MEPSLQPSFKFPSHHQNQNYAKGLLEQSAISQLLLVRPKRNTDIDIQSSLQTPLTVPPTLDKDVLDVKPVLPVITPIYVQPGLAEGMTNLSTLTKANTNITQITSSNNALKRGNYRSAENILGRQLTQEEISNRTITPNVRVSQANPSSKIHLDETQKLLGVNVGESRKNFQARLNEFQNADTQLINSIAEHLGVDGNAVRELKTSLGFTGDSVLGFVKGDLNHQREVLEAFRHYYQATKGMHPDTRAEVLRDRSNLEGENRPIHSGKKARTEQAKYEANVRRNAREHPYGPFENNEEEGIGQEPSNPAIPYESDEIPEPPDEQFQGAPASIAQQLGRPQNVPIPSGNGDQVLTDEAKQNVQENIRFTDGFQDELMRAGQNLRKMGDRPTVSAPARPDMFAAIQDRMDIIRMANAGSDDESEFEDYKDSGVKMKVDALMNADVYRDGDEKMGGGPVAGMEREEKFVTDEEARFAQKHLFTEDLVMQRRAEGAAFASYGYNAWGFAELQDVYKRRERGEALDETEIASMKKFARMLGYQRRKERDDAYSLEGSSAISGKRNRKSDNSVSMEGGSIGGRGGERRRTTKHQHLEKREQETPWVPQTSSFGDKGAIISGNLMRRTGYDAVPISAQLQVANTHQYSEAPLLEWVKHPNMSSDVRPDPIPIAQYNGPNRKVGVSARKKKVEFGGYLIDHHKLLNENVLSLSHKTGKKVKGFPNREISNGLKEAIHQVLTGGKVNPRKLSAVDKLRLKDLLSRSAANVDVGGDVNVSPSQQLQVIMGEMSAGNDAPELKAQLKKLLPILVKGGTINKEQASSIREHYC